MADFKEDYDWICTDERQQELIALFATSHHKWHNEIASMVQSHPSKFEVLNIGTAHDGGHDPAAITFTFDEFSSHFKGRPGTIHNDQLLRMIYDDVERRLKAESGSDSVVVKLIDIHLWLNNKRRMEKKEVVQNEKWLRDQIAATSFNVLNVSGSGSVDRDEFRSHFVDKMSMESEIADALFNDIDKKGNGSFSLMEYMRWQSKHSVPDKLKRFSSAEMSPRADDRLESPRSNEVIPETEVVEEEPPPMPEAVSISIGDEPQPVEEEPPIEEEVHIVAPSQTGTTMTESVAIEMVPTNGAGATDTRQESVYKSLIPENNDFTPIAFVMNNGAPEQKVESPKKQDPKSEMFLVTDNRPMLKCWAICACFAVPLFVGSLALIIFEHQKCPDGAAAEPDNNPLTDDNPNHCVAWDQCIDHVTFECTDKDPDVGLLIFFYCLLATALLIWVLFLWRTSCFRAYHECAQFTDRFRRFFTAFNVLFITLTMLIIGLILTVEGSHHCPDGSWKVANHHRVYNPNSCEKCVEDADTNNCVEDYDVDTLLLEVGIVMILLSTAVSCGVCWFLVFSRKVDNSDLSNELMLSKKRSGDGAYSE